MDAALLEATHALHDIAHVSPGDVERLVEQQALDVNLDLLRNRWPLQPQHWHTASSFWAQQGSGLRHIQHARG